MRTLGVETIEAYRAWCLGHGFGPELRKPPHRLRAEVALAESLGAEAALKRSKQGYPATRRSRSTQSSMGRSGGTGCRRSSRWSSAWFLRSVERRNRAGASESCCCTHRR
jgi:hypothetical protein